MLLRVPSEDWAAVSFGYKTEFRWPENGRSPGDGPGAHPPTPVVAYTELGSESFRQLMVLVEHRLEVLFLITEHPDSISREGFDTYEQFRAYWRRRYAHQPYHPQQKVHVYRVRPWTEEDYTNMGVRLLDDLYGEYIDDLQRRQLQS